MITLLIEIEALLNTRPLLYVESNWPSGQPLRPIDFLQNEFEVPFPLDVSSEEQEDPTFVAPEDRVLIQTKAQAITALQNSCKTVEKFWQIWRAQYLTSLREKHQQEIRKQRASCISPKAGDIVLISEPTLPRHMWKLGRIHELGNHSEIVRDAVVILPSRRKIRRPINLLVPLELDVPSLKENNKERKQEIPAGSVVEENLGTTLEQANSRSSHYNLRPRQPVNYNVLNMHKYRKETSNKMYLRWGGIALSHTHALRNLRGGLL
ncbi:hypothetical protein ANCCAN_07907 [Ancylostoma caninum]|uniref:DUF5641 domain-containing protein n=1 Tax=Ancylostoma caninum TaxID=29170 RepID=A0A368GNU8_ANCCA|nr:hypothetical protein ANCCAN_07907 [Ancylostoma caninum]